LMFDIERFGARCAYTLDASQPGELQDETFDAVEVTVTIIGVDVHSGWATGKLVNAARVAGRFLAALPPELSPEGTADRQGFVHPYEVEATPARAVVRAIVRDFEQELLEQHVALVRRLAEEVVAAEPRAQVEVEVKHQYSNMRRYLEAFPEIVERAARAIEAEGLQVVREPIRGGTDGSILSARGLPTPNLFTGGHEYHSVREWASVQDMASAAATVVRLAGEWAGARVLL
jgi:tripeptide aminopeptidase